jgi:hypothetical protein
MPGQLQLNNLEPVSAEQNMSVYVCTSTAELYQNLGITAAMAAGTAFGTFKTRLEFANEIQSTSTSVTILVLYTRITGGDSLQAVEFTQAPTDALSLYRQGGDSYVSSVSTGGYYVAALNFETYDETTFKNVKTQADADFSGWKGSLSAEFASNITEITKQTQTTSTFHQRGEGFTAPMPDRDTFLAFVNGFGSPAFELDRPAVLDFSVQSYTSVAGCPAGFRVIDDYIDSWDGSSDITPGTRLANIAEKVLAAEKLLNNVQTLYDFYGCLAAEPKLATAQGQYTKILSDIDAWRKAVDEDPTKPGIAVPAISDADLNYPIAQYSLLTGRIGPGGEGGLHFHDIELAMIGRLVTSTQVAVLSRDFVKKIDVTYSMARGDKNNSWTVSHGKGDDNPNAHIEFGPGETINQAGPLWWGDLLMVEAVNFGTTSQNVQLGREGSANGNAFWTKTNTTCLVGFIGSVGLDLRRPIPGVQALGIQYVQFLPCKWEAPPITPNFKARSTKPSPNDSFRDPGDLQIGGTPVDLVISPERLLKDFLVRDHLKIFELYNENGGWENWLQCELTYHMRTTDRRRGLEREQDDVYANARLQRCDVFLTQRPIANVEPETVVIELKAAGVRRTPTDLFNGVRDDIAKMYSADPRINKFSARWGRVRAYALGAFVDVDPQTAFDGYNGWTGVSPKPSLDLIGNPVDGKRLALVSWNYKNYT